MVHQTARVLPVETHRPATISRSPLLSSLLLIFMFSVCVGCDDGESQTTSPYGSGEVQLLIGVDDPWMSVEGARFSVDEGLQGGYHVDISIKAAGTLDPDSVDINLELSVDGRRIARHVTDDWLLKIYPEDVHCEYPRARLVFTDADDGLMPLDEVEGLIGSRAELLVSLRSPQGNGEAIFDIRLDRLNRR